MKRLTFFSLLFLVFLASACSVLQQANEVAAFSKCEFRLESVTDMKMAPATLPSQKNSVQNRVNL